MLNSYRADVNGVEGKRNLRVDESFVGPCDGLYDVRLHLVRGDIAKVNQGLAAVQHHYIDLLGGDSG